MDKTTVVSVDAGQRRVSRRTHVAAQPAEVYALLSDPHRHAELDGSGTVRDTDVRGPHQLSVGDKFTVGMKQYGLPYKITSTATAIEPNRLVEWQHPLGHRWRWELADDGGGTQVTETFDYTTAKAPVIIELMGMHKKNAEGIEATLQQLAARFA